MLSDHLVIATTGRRTVALLVDETKGVIETCPDSYASGDAILPHLQLLVRAIKLADGLLIPREEGRRS